MPPRRIPRGGGSPGPRREAKHGGNKNGKKEGLTGSSFFTWFMVIALLGVWTSVAVVWFELVDYEEVLAKAKDFRYNLSEVLQGKLGIYDADGDGDFDVEDAKVLLGLKERSVPAQQTPRDAEESIQPEEQPPIKSEHKNTEAEEEIQSLLHEALRSQLGEGNEDDVAEELKNQHQQKDEVHEEIHTADEHYETLEDEIPEEFQTPGPNQEEPASHYQVDEPGVETPEVHVSDEHDENVEERAHEPEVPDEGELDLEDALKHETEDGHQDYDDEHESNHGEVTETHDTESQPNNADETADEEPVNEHDYEERIQEPVHDTEKKGENTESVNEAAEPEETAHTEDHVAADQETEIPLQAEDHSKEDVVDT